nr:hypothetical protein [Tanacetum cinerariifolium]
RNLLSLPSKPTVSPAPKLVGYATLISEARVNRVGIVKAKIDTPARLDTAPKKAIPEENKENMLVNIYADLDIYFVTGCSPGGIYNTYLKLLMCLISQ